MSKNTQIINVRKTTLDELEEIIPHRTGDSWTIKINNLMDEYKRIKLNEDKL